MHTCIRWPFLINRACAEIVAPDESTEKFLTLKEINILNQNDQQDKFWLIALCSVLTEVYTLAHVIYIPRAYNLRTTCIWKISDYCKLHPKKCILCNLCNKFHLCLIPRVYKSQMVNGSFSPANHALSSLMLLKST